MKFLISVLLIALLAFISCIYFPWYSIAIFAFLINIIIPHRPAKAFLTGFTALFLLWAGLGWWINAMNESILSVRIARLLPLGGSAFLLILITGLVGGLTAGLASLAASYLKSEKAAASTG